MVLLILLKKSLSSSSNTVCDAVVECCHPVLCCVMLFQDVGGLRGEELTGPLELRGPVKQGHCLTNRK